MTTDGELGLRAARKSEEMLLYYCTYSTCNCMNKKFSSVK